MSGPNEIFQEYKNSPIALYGLGTETEKALSLLDDEYRIVGLLDSFRKDGMIYDKPIISLEKCAEFKVKLIVVVARPGSCRVIARKIGNFCRENQIALLDVRGRDLCVSRNVVYNFKSINGITRKQLLKQIDENEIVSVDLFDTLIMRQTLFAADVIELTDRQLKKKGICIEGFCDKRQQGEKELSKYSAPTLEEIYQFVLDSSEPVEVTAKELAQLEWEVDAGLLVPRQEMTALLDRFYRQGKELYIVTDTYYGKEQLIKILEKCKITGYTDILASCEYGTGKAQGLFEELKNRIQGRSCLHIGDDLTADIEGAERSGILACRIYSGLDLLEMAGYLGMWENTDKLASRLKIGMFIAKAFNSPFQFETECKAIAVRDAYEIGYLFMAPMVTDFVVWFDSQVEKNSLKNIWFGARDGYLIKKLYDILKGENPSVYFLTSRMAAIRAGIEDESDIEYVAGMNFNGTLQQQMKERFGLKVEEGETKGKSLSDFSRRILSGALTERKNYQAYIDSLPLYRGDIAFFDFVAKGTSQMYIGRLVDRHIKGLYFLQLEKEYMKSKALDISSFYEDGDVRTSAIYENYYILETILTSHEPSVSGFDENGNVIYAHETRSEQALECFRKMQEGIIDYFKDYIRLCTELKEGVDRLLDEIFLDLVHKFEIRDKEFINLKVEDPFFNRMTNMADLL